MSDAKCLFVNESVNIRSLYKRPDNTYFVRVETFNFETNAYNPSYDINYGLFAEAWDCVNYKDNQLNQSKVKRGAKSNG
jgi:hypothetical protein